MISPKPTARVPLQTDVMQHGNYTPSAPVAPVAYDTNFGKNYSPTDRLDLSPTSSASQYFGSDRHGRGDSRHTPYNRQGKYMSDSSCGTCVDVRG